MLGLAFSQMQKKIKSVLLAKMETVTALEANKNSECGFVVEFSEDGRTAKGKMTVEFEKYPQESRKSMAEQWSSVLTKGVQVTRTKMDSPIKKSKSANPSLNRFNTISKSAVVRGKSVKNFFTRERSISKEFLYYKHPDNQSFNPSQARMPHANDTHWKTYDAKTTNRLQLAYITSKRICSFKSEDLMTHEVDFKTMTDTNTETKFVCAVRVVLEGELKKHIPNFELPSYHEKIVVHNVGSATAQQTLMKRKQFGEFMFHQAERTRYGLSFYDGITVQHELVHRESTSNKLSLAVQGESNSGKSVLKAKWKTQATTLEQLVPLLIRAGSTGNLTIKTQYGGAAAVSRQPSDGGPATPKRRPSIDSVGPKEDESGYLVPAQTTSNTDVNSYQTIQMMQSGAHYAVPRAVTESAYAEARDFKAHISTDAGDDKDKGGDERAFWNPFGASEGSDNATPIDPHVWYASAEDIDGHYQTPAHELEDEVFDQPTPYDAAPKEDLNIEVFEGEDEILDDDAEMDALKAEIERLKVLVGDS